MDFNSVERQRFCTNEPLHEILCQNELSIFPLSPICYCPDLFYCNYGYVIGGILRRFVPVFYDFYCLAGILILLGGLRQDPQEGFILLLCSYVRPNC